MMKSCLLASALLFLALGGSISVAEGASNMPVEQQAARANEILERYRGDSQQPASRQLQLICWTPADRDFPARYEERLDGILKYIQKFYAAEMQRHGFGERSINLPLDENGQVRLFSVQGRHPSEYYHKQSGREIREECKPVLAEAGVDADRETIVIFCNLADWDAENLKFDHRSPYYAGGSQRGGTAWQLDSVELEVDNLQKKQPLIIDGQYGRISLGKHNSIFIGGIAHELGHALGLPHCTARPDEAELGTVLMGSGNRTFGDELRGEGKGTKLSFAHALRLASHPQFSESTKGIDSSPSLSLTDLAINTDGRNISVEGTIAGEPPVYGVVAYFDPEGNSDYNATTVTAVPDEQGRFQLATTAFPKGKNGELRIVPLHCNGAAGNARRDNRLSFPYRIDASGRPDISAAQTRLELVPIVEALSAGDREEATRLTEQLQQPTASKVANRLLNPVQRTLTPAEFSPAVTRINLSQSRPDVEQVGWARPSYDRLPDSRLLLAAGQQIFETGLYAHAPARHVYQLNSSWEQLRGQAGIAAGHSGSVQFEIRGDDRTLWKSSVLTAGTLARFDVDVRCVQQLELLTHPTDDGAGSDWGLWLDPSLSR